MISNKQLNGVILTVLSALGYSIMSSIIQAESKHLSISTIVFLQNFFTFIAIAIYQFRRGNKAPLKELKTTRTREYILRTVATLGANYAMFYSLKFIPLVDAVTLFNTAPLMLPFIAYFLFSKPINKVILLPICIGFIGVVLILKPGGGILDTKALYALGAGACMALAMLYAKLILLTESPIPSLFHYFTYALIISAPIAWFNWTPVSGEQWLWILAIGILSIAIQMGLTYALTLISAQEVSILYYSVIIFSVILSFLVLHTPVGLVTISGIVLICLGSIWVILKSK